MRKNYISLSLIPIDVRPEAQVLAGTPTDVPQDPDVYVDPYLNDQRPGGFDPISFD